MSQFARASKSVRPEPASNATRVEGPGWRSASLVFPLCLAIAAACGGDGGGTGTRDTGPRGDTGPADTGAGDTGPSDCTSDVDCPDDGVFCNGRFRCQGGRCVAADIPTCNDGTACTQDMCMPVGDICQNTPNDTLCPTGLTCVPGMGCVRAAACEFDSDCEGDGIFCNGDEVCVDDPEDMVKICASPGTRSCDDFDNCTMDECTEVSGECMHVMRTDNLTNPEACGPECEPCPIPPPEGHAVPVCLMGVCGYECEPGFFDADTDPSNWCESDCFPSPDPDLPDDTFADLNCDGIDGTAAEAIFVATTGRDINPGTRAMPKRTIRAGIEAAGEVGFDVYISEGDYNEGPEALALVDGVSIYGGYSEERDWERSNDFIVTINGGTLAVDAVNIATDTTVDRINVRASGSTSAGGSSIGVRAVDSPGLTWRVSEVTAGNGVPGEPGSPGVDGLPGSEGGESVGGLEYGCTGAIFCFGCIGMCGNNMRAPQPRGGVSPCASTGGPGGRGGPHDGSGESGGVGLGVGGGSAGSAGSATSSGGTGGTGSDGVFTPMMNGAGGMGAGRISGDMWLPGSGADGQDGAAGAGGGGGGGGGGDNTDCCETWGDTGSGGGGGGCGGTSGTGGGGGGGSIAFLVIRSPMTFDMVLVVTGNGGGGARGAAGGLGGAGGRPGYRRGDPEWTGTWDDEDNPGPGGPGGRGGRGSQAGAGGGGAGGPAIGILRDAASSISTRGVSYERGRGGTGGDSPGNRGANGVEADEHVL